MKDDIRRIMKLVQEGKLSPDDATELIEAFSDGPEPESATGAAPKEAKTEGQGEPTPETEAEGEPDTGKTATKTAEPLSSIIEAIEKLGKDVATNVNWSDIAKSVKDGVQKGVEAVKQAAEEARKGRGFTLFGHAETKTVDLPLHIPEGKVLRIEGQAGDVTVVGGHSVGSVKLVATFRGINAEEAKTKADLYTPVLEESDRYVLLRQPDGIDMHVDVEARVGSTTPVEVKLNSGEVAVNNAKAGVRVQSKSGAVRLADCGGALDVAVTSGDVSVTRSDASVVNVESKSGDLSLTAVSGIVSLRTSTGDVKFLEGKARNLSVEVATGNVTVGYAEPVTGSVNVRTVSGDAEVAVPDASDARVQLSTLRGDVSCEIELQDEAKEAQRITGRLGDGQGSLDVSTVNGDVTLKLSDAS